MRKYILFAITVLIIGSMAYSQCSTGGLSIVASKNASKCYGALATLNAMTAKTSFYYDFEYSAFTKSPIACETPVFNNDTGTFFGRARSWSNGGACATLYGCPIPTSGNQTVYTFTGVNAAGYLSNVLMEACQANGSNWTCAGTGLPTWTAGTPTTCAQADATWHPAMNIGSVSCDGNTPTNCAVYLTISNPTYGQGLYGTAGLSLISGYRIFYNNTSGKSPASGAIANWTATSTYIPYTAGSGSAGVFNYTGGTPGTPVYLAFIPVFNNRAATAIGTLWNASLVPGNGLNVASSQSQSPYYAEFIPTPVTISSFTGKYINLQHIALTWVTASETDAAGFNVYRSLDQTNWTQVNSALIPAKGQGGAGATYTLTDNLPKQRTYQKWYYKLDEISSNGQRSGEKTTSVTR